TVHLAPTKVPPAVIVPAEVKVPSADPSLQVPAVAVLLEPRSVKSITHVSFDPTCLQAVTRAATSAGRPMVPTSPKKNPPKIRDEIRVTAISTISATIGVTAFRDLPWIFKVYAEVRQDQAILVFLGFSLVLDLKIQR